MNIIKAYTDDLDIAYLAIGAHRAIEQADPEQLSAFKDKAGMGEDGLLRSLIDVAAPLLAEAWANMQERGDDPAGVWYYEISDPLGFMVMERDIKGENTDARTMRSMIESLINEMQGPSFDPSSNTWTG